MKKYILSLLWISSLALCQAGTDSKDMKELTPVVAPADKQAFNVYTGYGARNSSYYTYAGVVYAIDGDINSSGWLLRSQIGGGQYAYNTPLVQGRVRGNLMDATLSFGYKQYIDPDWSVTGFLGAHYRDRELNVIDPGSNVTTSDKVGAFTALELTGTPSCFYVDGNAQFSTVDISTWNRLRLGYNFVSDGIIVGPEGLYMRDKNYYDYRGGAFVMFQINKLIGLTFSGGYASYTSQGGAHSETSSPYGDVGLSFGF